MTFEKSAEYLDGILLAWDFLKPLVVGISGPQGSGKSYLADRLILHLRENHPQRPCIGVLVDDFYLTHAEQQEISKKAGESGNFLLNGRGLPGTHDLDLAFSTLHRLVARQYPVKVPRYDKSAYGGQGDRYGPEKWQLVHSPVDIIVFEGWFIGFNALDAAIFPCVYLSNEPSGVVQRSSLHHLEDINRKLSEYEKLWAFIDYSVLLCTPDLDYVYSWRLEQERDLIRRTGKGMCEEAVAAFVRRYMPMYHLYYWRLCDSGLLPRGTNLCLHIDFQRALLRQERK